MKSNNQNAGATNASSTSGEGGQNPVVTPTKPPIRDHELSKDCWCQPTVDGEAPDEVSLGEQIEHQRSIYGGDIETFGTESEWTIKSGSILASLLELQIRRDSAPSAPAAETVAVLRETLQEWHDFFNHYSMCCEDEQGDMREQLDATLASMLAAAKEETK